MSNRLQTSQTLFERFRLPFTVAGASFCAILLAWGFLSLAGLVVVIQEQTQLVLEKPRQAIAQSQDHHVQQWDSRLSAAGNRLAKRMSFLLDSLSKMNTYLRFEGRGQLQDCDRVPLLPGFTKLQQEATLLIEANNDFIKELQLP